MAADALEDRIAQFERAYEQIDKRLDSLDSRMASLEGKVDDAFTQLHAEMHVMFRWVTGMILVNWITIMLAVFLHR